MRILEQIDAWAWGPLLLVLILGTGILLTIRLRGIQFRKFGFILKNTLCKMFDRSNMKEGEISPFAALSTALAATVGTGNIVGVATAILMGGPGAVFWMWLAAIVGMATKFSEVTLSVAYRVKDRDGHWAGGPMYYIDRGLGLPWLGKFFACFAALATFGIGNSTQSNAIASILNTNLNIHTMIVGIVLSILVAIVILGGIHSISKVTEKLVPMMAAFYMIGGITVLIANAHAIPGVVSSIFSEAFSTRAAAGGAAGSVMALALRSGTARGVFTNEAGLGSSPIAQASASADHPTRQGIWGVFEVFIDTIVVCTITALVILTSGVLEDPSITADVASATAFSSVFSWGKYIVTIGLVLFAFSTILGWEYYGERAARYLFGDKITQPYRFLYILVCFLGTQIELGVAWTIADILNAMMAFPNLVGLLFLSGDVVRLTKDFFDDPDRIRTSPDEYRHLLKGKGMEPVKEEG